MRTSITVIMLLFTASIAGAQALSQDKPDFAGVELLGRGLLYSVNYERSLSPRFGAGLGVAHWSTGNGNATIIPLYVSSTAGKKHRLYVAAGATFAISNARRTFENSKHYHGGAHYSETGAL